jgi:hypothetical protein
MSIQGFFQDVIRYSAAPASALIWGVQRDHINTNFSDLKFGRGFIGAEIYTALCIPMSWAAQHAEKVYHSSLSPETQAIIDTERHQRSSAEQFTGHICAYGIPMIAAAFGKSPMVVAMSGLASAVAVSALHNFTREAPTKEDIAKMFADKKAKANKQPTQLTPIYPPKTSNLTDLHYNDRLVITPAQMQAMGG